MRRTKFFEINSLNDRRLNWFRQKKKNIWFCTFFNRRWSSHCIQGRITRSFTFEFCFCFWKDDHLSRCTACKWLMGILFFFYPVLTVNDKNKACFCSGQHIKQSYTLHNFISSLHSFIHQSAGENCFFFLYLPSQNL